MRDVVRSSFAVVTGLVLMKTAIFSLTSGGDVAPVRGRWSSAEAVSRKASSRSAFKLFSVKKFSSAAAARSAG